MSKSKPENDLQIFTATIYAIPIIYIIARIIMKFFKNNQKTIEGFVSKSTSDNSYLKDINFPNNNFDQILTDYTKNHIKYIRKSLGENSENRNNHLIGF